MTIQAIIFDFGGVLVRTEDRAPRAALAASLGKSVQQLEEIVFSGHSGRAWQLGQITTPQHWENVRKLLGLDADEVEAFRRAFFGGDVLDRQLVAIIRALQPRYTTAILSNMGDDLRGGLKHYWRIADAFDHIIVSAEEGVTKPEAAIYHIALRRVGAAPEEAVFIDDFASNVAAAREVGMHAIHFQSREQVVSALRGLGVGGDLL